MPSSLPVRVAAPERALTVHSPAIPEFAGRPALVPLKLTGREAVNELFEYRLLLQTPDALAAPAGVGLGADLPLADFIGRDLSCRLELEGHGLELPGVPGGNRSNQGAGVREINGLVTDARLLGVDSRHAVYELTLRPGLHLATLGAGCRVFQDLTPVQILQALLAHYPVPVDWRLTEAYPVRDYVVQYNETDFQFISRLLQEWGINYHFEHAAGVHRLVLCDHNGGFTPIQPDEPASSYHRLAFYPLGHKTDEEYIHAFAPLHRLTAGAYASAEHDYTRPRAALSAEARDPQQTGQAGQEVYLWRGAQTLGTGDGAVHLAASDWNQPNKGADRQAHATEPQGQHLARLRMQALRQVGERAHGQAHCRGIAAGHSFTLVNHPSQAANTEYLTLAATLCVENVSEDTAREGKLNDLKALADPERLTGRWRCTVDFEVQPTRELLRPQATQPKPHIPGPETALVCGPAQGTAESNLYTDHLGRIKVQFFWDRDGPRNQTSSCWLRVSQGWAGNQLGAMFLPRVGEEVMVEFLSGDIDRPICTGRLHHQDQLPPWRLPGQQALSGIRSRELRPGGGNAAAGRSNHLVLDDTDQAIQAQLKSDHQHTSLSLGHVTRIESHQGRQDHRGQGFELRTDGHGAVRAQHGLILTTEARPNAQGHLTDLSETAQRLAQAQGQHGQLGELAEQHQAQEAGDQAVVAREVSQQNEGIHSKSAPEGGFPELKEPHLVMASPAGIASTTAGSTHQHSERHHAVTSGGHTSLSVGGSLLASVKGAIRLFAYKAGIKLVSAASDIDLQALDTSIHVLAKVDITHTANCITFNAKEEIAVNGGGSYTRWKAGAIESGTPGQHVVHAASHAMEGAKSLAQASQAWPSAAFNDHYVVRHPRTQEPQAGVRYRLSLEGVGTVEGVTDAQGRIPMQRGMDPAKVGVTLLGKQ
ncbi:type VI secretion system Vgr family protein [Roseateles sp.]|uniref:type VI secretion system Vgr family protein n=1 Tax=Roseateles sp. TaxID=1971397 RepID=UPI002E0A92FF|nr:type VI secretion system tip protein TssI/VgrG [Roseateles sp.]HEV6964076.1 type VI secretion system tip protein TssI/VgrG [Roseateles sp.]